MPMRNAAAWLDETFRSLMEQIIDQKINVELSIYNDGSSASDHLLGLFEKDHFFHCE